MQLPIQPLALHGRSLQDQLFDQFVGFVGDGRLPPGTRMPSTRQLALDLGVSRNTVVQTYERLVAEGFIEMRGPLGAFVTEHGGDALVPPQRAALGQALPAMSKLASPRASPPAPAADAAEGLVEHALHAMRSPYADELAFDFWVGRPDARLFPALAWRKLVNEALLELQHSDGSYGEPAGLMELRAAVARHVGASRGIVCSGDDVIITNGIQEGINIVARLFVAPGVPVGMECPGYLGAANVWASFGARLLPVEVDAEGARPGALPPECRLMYLTPAHQYPTGVALSPPRRAQWLAWALQRGGYLLEDDYDSDFYYDSVPPAAIKAGDGDGRVIYLGTFSKSLAAGLRTGYMIVPRQLRRAAVIVKGLLTSGSPRLTQTALAAFLDCDEYAHQLRRLRKVYASRRDALRAALRELFASDAVSGSGAGMHVLWHLPPGLPAAREVERVARGAGVGVYSLDSGNTWLGDEACRQRAERTLLLGYAALNEAEIATGLSRLQRALQAAREH